MYGLGCYASIAAVFLSAVPAAQAGLYPKSSSVLQANAKTYDKLVTNSNHTSIVEFYAPWCGHCQNLKPAYEKAARNLQGLANVVAMDCDDDANKPFCGRMGVQGFPTLKIVRPGKKTGRPVVEDYQGPRTASGIVDAVLAKLNNHVKKVTDADADAFLDADDKPKVLVFSDKGATSPLLKSLAIDYLGIVTFGQVRNKETKTVERFGVSAFPTLVLLPGGSDQEPVVYEGKIKRDALLQFLVSQVGEPNTAAAAAAAATADASSSAKAKAKTAKKDKKTGSASADAAVSDSDSNTTTATTDDASSPSSSGTHNTAPSAATERAPPIPTLDTLPQFRDECVHAKAKTCVLVFLPPPGVSDAEAQRACDSLAEVALKHAQSKRPLFPFFAVSSGNPASALVQTALGLGENSAAAAVVAVHVRKGWWKQYEGDDYSHESINGWIDAIRMGEGTKKTLPEGLTALYVETDSAAAPEQPASSVSAAPEEPTPDTLSTSTAASEKAAEPTPEGIKHEEL